MEIAITSIIVLAAILTVSAFAGKALLHFGFFENNKSAHGERTTND